VNPLVQPIQLLQNLHILPGSEKSGNFPAIPDSSIREQIQVREIIDYSIRKGPCSVGNSQVHNYPALVLTALVLDQIMAGSSSPSKIEVGAVYHGTNH